jgi:hypothetical protein
MASWPVVSGTPGNCTCGTSAAAAGESCVDRMRRSATAEMRYLAIFVTSDGHASWKAPLIMKAQAPRRFAAWKPLPAFSHPMDTARKALRIATAPAQPEISNSSSMMSFQGWCPVAIRRAEWSWRAIGGRFGRGHCRLNHWISVCSAVRARASFAWTASLDFRCWFWLSKAIMSTTCV